jgi:hypothetical protein
VTLLVNGLEAASAAFFFVAKPHALMGRLPRRSYPAIFRLAS